MYIAVETATVGCISKDISKGLNMIPPPTPTIDDKSPPKNAMTVTRIKVCFVHSKSPSVK